MHPIFSFLFALVLGFISMHVITRLLLDKDPWKWIVTYWIILAIKNLAESIHVFYSYLA